MQKINHKIMPQKEIISSKQGRNLAQQQAPKAMQKMNHKLMPQKEIISSKQGRNLAQPQV